MDPRRFIGRAPEQVDEFVIAVVEPIRERYRERLGESVQLRV
jgi:adenylosuccinate lyase